ncbi:hypothetical protein MTO96_005347 [Rhipicephalus appendiculatus]
MREVLPVAMLLLLTPPCSAPFLRHRKPPFYDFDPLEDNVQQPRDKSFFSDFIQRRKVPTFGNLLDQVRLHQPYIYQLFQVTVVLTNIGIVSGVCIVVLRFMGTCGASTSQDITINYRLLFHAYTASSWLVCAGVVFVAIFALSCDYSLDRGDEEIGEIRTRLQGEDTHLSRRQNG